MNRKDRKYYVVEIDCYYNKKKYKKNERDAGWDNVPDGCWKFCKKAAVEIAKALNRLDDCGFGKLGGILPKRFRYEIEEAAG